jgi:HEPN domain-containing protein
MEIKIALDAYARSIFRDEADADYIAARSNFRLQLRQQFLWSAQQALEKYLKSILLFNGKSARYIDIEKAKISPRDRDNQFTHDLNKLLNNIKDIHSFDLDTGGIANDQFLRYLADQGPNRYISKSAYTTQDALERLDSTIWHVRRYCQNFECSSPALSAEQQSLVRQASISRALDPKSVLNPHLFRLSPGQSGYLEKVLSKRSAHPARKALVWANRFYGSKKRRRIQYRVFSASAIPPQEREGWPAVDFHDIGMFVQP